MADSGSKQGPSANPAEKAYWDELGKVLEKSSKAILLGEEQKKEGHKDTLTDARTVRCSTLSDLRGTAPAQCLKIQTDTKESRGEFVGNSEETQENVLRFKKKTSDSTKS